MSTHYLKTWPEFFQAVLDGRKPFEVRKDDRDFHEGDTLVLQEFEPATATYSGREVTKEVSYALRGPGFGVEAGYCVLGMVDGIREVQNER